MDLGGNRDDLITSIGQLSCLQETWQPRGRVSSPKSTSPGPALVPRQGTWSSSPFQHSSHQGQQLSSTAPLRGIASSSESYHQRRVGPAQQSPGTSTWPQVVAQTRNLHMAFGSNMGHGQPQGPCCCRTMPDMMAWARYHHGLSWQATYIRLFITAFVTPVLPLFLVHKLLLFGSHHSTTYLLPIVEWFPHDRR